MKSLLHKIVQHGNDVLLKKCNMKRVQHEKIKMAAMKYGKSTQE